VCSSDLEEALALADRLAVLDRGRLVQVGTPVDIHDRPATTLVARLTSWPPINLLPGRVCLHEGRPALQGAGAVLALPASWAAHVGLQVVVGLRPAAIRAASPGHSSGNAQVLKVQVLDVRPGFPLATADLRYGGWAMTGLLPGTVPGPSLSVEVDLTKALLFDAHTGLALRHGG